jgi:hypothetical protein
MPPHWYISTERAHSVQSSRVSVVKKFEYAIAPVRRGQQHADQIAEVLNGLGHQRWELVTTYQKAASTLFFIFK